MRTPDLIILLSLLSSFMMTGAAEPQQISFRTLCVKQLPDLPKLWVREGPGGGKLLEVPLYEASMSPVIEGRFEGGELVFFGSDPGRGKAPRPVARGVLGKSDQQLFVFAPSEDDPGEYEMMVFEDDVERFKLGSIRLINLAPVEVRFSLGGVMKDPIAASDHAEVPQPREANEYGMYPVVAEFKGDDEGWTRAYSASWRRSDRRRQIVVTMLDKRFNQPVVKIIADTPPWLEE